MFGFAAVGARVGDVMAGHRAVGAVMVRLRLIEARDYRLDDLHRRRGEPR